MRRTSSRLACCCAIGSRVTLDACNSSILPILSLSCVNVGRCSGFCSQQSLMIVYMSSGQLWGCSMRWPSLRKSSNCSVGIPGYGVPPSVKISHKQIPNDQLWDKHATVRLGKKNGAILDSLSSASPFIFELGGGGGGGCGVEEETRKGETRWGRSEWHKISQPGMEGVSSDLHQNFARSSYCSSLLELKWPYQQTLKNNNCATNV